MRSPRLIFCTLTISLAAAFTAPAQAGPQDNWYYDQAWGVGTISMPHQMAEAPDGRIYLATYQRIMVFRKDGELDFTFGSAGPADGQFGDAVDIAIGQSNLVYVADLNNQRVQVFDKDGNFVRKWGTPGSGDGQFSQPMAIDVATDGLVYVAERSNHRVQVFTPDGTFVRKWGSQGVGQGQFDNPRALAIGPDGLIYVGDGAHPGAQVFQPDGTYVRSLGTGSQFFCIGADGCIYFLNGVQVYMYGLDGSSLKTWNVPYSAQGAAVTKDGAMLISASIPEGSRIAVYRRTYRTAGLASPSAVPLPVVLSASQRSGTAYMDIDYMVTDADSSNITAAALAFAGGSNTLDSVLLMNTFVDGTETNLGASIPANRLHRLTWNAAADWSTEFGEVQVEILANDGRDLVDFHFITIPSNAPDPELTITCSPILQSDLLSCWYWLIATNDLALNLITGTVYGVSGVYSGEVLAVSSSTTEDGRAFLFERMNVREATAQELARAREGTTPGTVHQWDPRFQVGPGVRPKKVNEFGFDTGDWGPEAWWVVPVP